MLDIAIGDRFILLLKAPPGEFEVVGYHEGYISFRRCPDGETFRVGATDFAVDHANSDVFRTARNGQALSVLSVKHLLTFFAPEGRAVTVGEVEDWEEQGEILTGAATKQFYGNRYIDYRRKMVDFGHGGKNLDYSKTEDGLTDFIELCHPEAKKRGLGKWTPSASTIRRLVYERADYLSLADCIWKTGTVRRKNIWPQEFYDLADQAIGKVFSGEMPSVLEAYKWFWGEFFRERDEGVGIPIGRRQTPPCEKTFRTWTSDQTTAEKIAKLYGEREAGRRLKGTISPQDAIAPLQIVIIDQTEGNIWSAVKERGHEEIEFSSLVTDDEFESKGEECETETLASKRVQVVYAIDFCLAAKRSGSF